MNEGGEEQRALSFLTETEVGGEGASRLVKKEGLKLSGELRLMEMEVRSRKPNWSHDSALPLAKDQGPGPGKSGEPWEKK